MHANILPREDQTARGRPKTHGTAATASVESASTNISQQRKHRVDIMVFLEHQQAMFWEWKFI